MKNVIFDKQFFDKEMAKTITEQGKCILNEMLEKLKENGIEVKGITKKTNKR